jgi:5-methylcytosine-specific restriction endonuclease McrBC regulatory subunit McrC
MLEGKMENQQCNAIIRTLRAQSQLQKLKQENREILQKLKEVEEREQMANNKVQMGEAQT